MQFPLIGQFSTQANLIPYELTGENIKDIMVVAAKFTFCELRPNFLARCFYNETLGRSEIPENILYMDYNIDNCPGNNYS